jgi:hypothetical protein
MMLRRHCPHDPHCPEVKRVEEGYLRITGWEPGQPRDEHHERDVDVPASLLPEVADLEIRDFVTYRARLARPGGDQLRIQTLRAYAVESDRDFFDRYHSGGPGPTAEELSGPAQYLADEARAGRTYRNLHVIDTRGDVGIGDYLRYAFEWGYQFNTAHGMDVRILDLADHPAAGVVQRMGDYWVLEGYHVVLCRYDAVGHNEGWVGVDDGGQRGYVAAAELAWSLSTPFSQWWATHPQYHRANAAQVA